MKQKRNTSLIYLLERTLRQTKSALQEIFKQHEADVSVDQWIVLAEIGQSKKVNQRALAELTSKDPASITRIINLLVVKKLVTRIPVKSDKRQFYIELTKSGASVLRKCEAAVADFRKVVGKGLSQQELNDQRTTLDKLFENSGGRLI